MRQLRAVALRIRGLFRSRRSEADFDAELESHVALHTDDGIRAGLAPAEARRQALVRLGGAEQTRQAHRERRTLPRLESLLQDLPYGLRMMAHNRAFTAVAVLTLAIGIGASTAIFSAVKPILLDPLPYPHATRLMKIWETRRDGAPMRVTFGTFHGLAERTRSLSFMAVMKAWQPAMVPATQTDRPERFEGQRVSADYFRTLGISPLLGRDFQPSDDQFRGPDVTILSDRLWRRRFDADSAIVGKQVRLDDNLYTVIGVMPRAFENVLAPSAELWAPLQYNPSLPADGREWGHHLNMVGRLRPGVSREQAQVELNANLNYLAQIYVKGYDGAGGAPDGMLVNPLQSDLTQGVRPALLAVLGAVILVLLIACVNVANLLLARGIGLYGVLSGSFTERAREIGVRAALGASRANIVSFVMRQGMIATGIGLVIGFCGALAAARGLSAMLFSISWLDGPTYLGAAALLLAVSGVACWIPARRAASIDPIKALRTE